jgi:hypothetical protein
MVLYCSDTQMLSPPRFPRVNYLNPDRMETLKINETSAVRVARVLCPAKNSSIPDTGQASETLTDRSQLTKPPGINRGGKPLLMGGRNPSRSSTFPPFFLHLFGGLLGVNGRLLAHGGLDGHVCSGVSVCKANNVDFDGQLTGILLLSLEELGDLVTDITVGHADVVLLLALVIDEVEKTIVGDIDL